MTGTKKFLLYHPKCRDQQAMVGVIFMLRCLKELRRYRLPGKTARKFAGANEIYITRVPAGKCKSAEARRNARACHDVFWNVPLRTKVEQEQSKIIFY
jgi:hypothetical protein